MGDTVSGDARVADIGPAPMTVPPTPGDAESVLVDTAGTTPTGNAAAAGIARLLCLWLEALDGRRPVTALRRAPFSPLVLDDLRRLIRESMDSPGQPARAVTGVHGPGTGGAVGRTGTTAGPPPSRLLRVHLPPSHHRRLSFTASVAVSGRVRALVGHLGRYDSRWRVENIALV